MAKPIFFVSGSKGGVGKSMVSTALIDFLLEAGETPMLVESDTSNPDVGKTYKGTLEAKLINLDEKDGWINLINIAGDTPDSTIVVNTAARNNTGVKAFGPMLDATLGELGRKLVTLWVMNRQRDSLELLREYTDAIPGSQTHVLRNLYFGEESKFELYNASKTKKAIEEKGGKSLNFPDLADRVTDDMAIKRMTIQVALKELPIGNRAELIRWRGEAKKVFSQVAV